MTDINFRVESVDNVWAPYGITQKVGSFEGMPKKYKIIEVRTSTSQDVVKSPSFMPVPTAVSSKITRHVAKTLGLEIKEESNDGMRYFASLVSPSLTGEVEKDDLVAWGIIFRNNPTGPYRMDGFLLRLKCTNGMTIKEDSESSTIPKSREIEKMQESIIDKAQIMKDTFEEKLQLFRVFKQYKINEEFAEKLAKSFPKPIIQDIIVLGKKKTVQSFADVDLWKAYNAITYQLSHRELKTSTRVGWSFQATQLFEDFVKKQQEQTA